MRWEKSKVYKKAEIPKLGISAFVYPRKARLFKLVSYEAKKFSNPSNCQRQYELKGERRGYSRAA